MRRPLDQFGSPPRRQDSSFQDCRHHTEVRQWPGHRAERLLYLPSEACNAHSQKDEGKAEQGRSLWWQRRWAARSQISSQRPRCADLSKPGFQASLSVLGSPFV